MNLQSTLPARNQADVTVEPVPILQQLVHYAFYAGFGLVGGAMGTAVAIGLAIIVQSLQAPTTVFWPSVILLAIAATVIGWGVSWLLGRSAPYILSTLSPSSSSAELGLQIALIMSGLTSLIETYLFMAVL